MSITIPFNTRVHNAFCGFAWYYLSTLISFMRKPSSFLHSKIFAHIAHLFQLLSHTVTDVRYLSKFIVLSMNFWITLKKNVPIFHHIISIQRGFNWILVPAWPLDQLLKIHNQIILPLHLLQNVTFWQVVVLFTFSV